MPFQSTYSQYPDAAVAGMKVDSREDTVESFAAEGAIGFGLAVIKGTDGEAQVKKPAAAGGTFRGVSLRTSAMQRASDGSEGYADEDAVNVLRQGQVWVPIITNVTVDAPAFFDNGSAGAGANAGKFSATDDGTTDAVPTGVFRSAGTSGGLAKLELNLP